MTNERYKQLMEQVGMPQSRSLLAALQQVANEVAQEYEQKIELLKQQAPVFWGPRMAIKNRWDSVTVRAEPARETDIPLYLATGAQVAVQNGWQPIETAPKNTFLLLGGPSGYTTLPFVCTTGRMCSDYKVGRWIDHANDDLLDWGFEPTHWMPLPEQPK